MAKFIFAFEQLLIIKQKIEKQEQMNLGKAIQILSASVDKLKEIEVCSKEAVKEFQVSLNKGRIEQLKIRQLNEKIKYYHRQINGQKEIIKKNEKQVENVKEKLRKALQERRTFEILKEKAYEEYSEAEKAEEAKLNDEIVSFKHKTNQ